MLRTGRRLDWILEQIERNHFAVLTALFVGAYALLALLFGIGYYALWRFGGREIFSPPCDGLASCIYFSFVSQLTIGYGDLAPVGWARLLAVAQAMAAVVLAGIWIGLAVLKLTSPSRRSVIFSRQAYYIRDEQRFVLLFVNVNRQKLTHASVSTNVKLAGRNLPGCSHTAPYVGNSVWILTVDCVLVSDLRQWQPSCTPGDGLKVSISGVYGFVHYAQSLRYEFCDVRIVESRRQIELPEFTGPRLDARFWQLFHDPVPDAPRLLAGLTPAADANSVN
jgi:hypothetical protein